MNRFKRATLAAVILGVLATACGGSTSPDEYVEGLNDLVTVGFSDFEAAAIAYNAIEQPTITDEVAFLGEEVAIRRTFVDGLNALDPPDVATEVHRVLTDAVDRLLAAGEALLPVASTADSVEEAEQTAEFAEYRAANADGAQVCLDMQAKLDAIADGGQALANTPWLSDLGVTVQSALRCGELDLD